MRTPEPRFCLFLLFPKDLMIPLRIHPKNEALFRFPRKAPGRDGDEETIASKNSVRLTHRGLGNAARKGHAAGASGAERTAC